MELKIMEAFTSMKQDKEIGMPNIEDELSKVLAKRNKRVVSNWRKIAVSVAVIVTICSIAVATIINHRISVSNQIKSDVSRNIVATESRNTQSIPENPSLTVSHVVSFDNAELSEIMDSIGNVYKIEFVFVNEEIKHLHLHFKFDTSDTLNDIIQNLNMFERINIKEKEGILEVE